MSEQYLWDRSGPPDADVEQLEQTLSPLRHRSHVGEEYWKSIRTTSIVRPVAAAATIVIAGALTWVALQGRSPSRLTSWEVVSMSGTPTVDSTPLEGTGRLRIGSTIETDRRAAAHVSNAEIGSVTVGPDSQLRLLAAGKGTEHRLQLERGRIEALITAPPRLFFVDTACAVAVDLGCAYRLEVDDAGNGFLEVVLGWVALERDETVSTVPSGAACRLYAGRGPGTPVFQDASPIFLAAVHDFDASGEDRGEVIEAMLRDARPRDTMTLWHVLPHVDGAERRRVIDHMVELAGLPDDVAAEELMQLDPAMLSAWWSDLERGW